MDNRVGGQVISRVRVGRGWTIGLGGQVISGERVGWGVGNRVGGRSSAWRGLDGGGQ